MNHLEEINKTWFEHFKFAMGLSLRLLKLCLISFVHSFFPNILVHNVSEEIKELNDILNHSK